jgi:nucleotide-binding universal stress UspA family protein
MILIAYDGSRHGRRAIAVAAERLTGPAIVLHVLSPGPRPPLAADAMSGAMLEEQVFADGERRARREAEMTAAEGVRLARDAGLDAEPLVVEEVSHRIWRAIVDVAEQIDAQMIVLGHRGGHGLRTSMPGSVSRGVVAHSVRPVVVVPAEPEPRHYTSDAALKAFADVAAHTAEQAAVTPRRSTR